MRCTPSADAGPPGPRAYTAPVAELKPVYLVCGDDDAKIDAWRLRVRRRAEEERGPGGLEMLRRPRDRARGGGHGAGQPHLRPGRALPARGRRRGAGRRATWSRSRRRWPTFRPDTVLVLIVRGKPLKALRDAVEKAGGEVRDCAAPKAWELPKWAVERARELGLQLDGEGGQGARVAGRHEPAAAVARAREDHRSRFIPPRTPERRTWSDWPRATTPPRPTTSPTLSWPATCARCLALAEELESHGERAGRLVFPVVRRLREVHRAVALLESGMPEQKVAGSLGRAALAGQEDDRAGPEGRPRGARARAGGLRRARGGPARRRRAPARRGHGLLARAPAPPPEPKQPARPAAHGWFQRPPPP